MFINFVPNCIYQFVRAMNKVVVLNRSKKNESYLYEYE